MEYSPAFDKPLISGRLLRRYKRFLADIELASGEMITAHCPNTGAMTGCAEPGAPVLLSTSDNPKRKYAHTWEMVCIDGHWICIHSALANRLVALALEENRLSALSEIHDWRREVRSDGGSRIDFCGRDGTGRQFWMEVKSVTLHLGGGEGAFPDARSDRATRHIDTLLQKIREGERAALLFAVLHAGIDRVRAAVEIDPVYADRLHAAIDEGLEVYCYTAFGEATTTGQLALADPLPFLPTSG